MSSSRQLIIFHGYYIIAIFKKLWGLPNTDPCETAAALIIQIYVYASFTMFLFQPSFKRNFSIDSENLTTDLWLLLFLILLMSYIIPWHFSVIHYRTFENENKKYF